MTAQWIINHLMRRRYPGNFVLPNYTPACWWECDLFEVTKAGYFTEYEVKISVSDFWADRDKFKRVLPLWDFSKPEGQQLSSAIEKKHDKLQLGSTDGPRRFWFVTPAKLIPVDHIPDWAGLIQIHESTNGWPAEETVKEAPRLHQTKLDKSVMSHAYTVGYHRFHNLRHELADLKAEMKMRDKTATVVEPRLDTI